MLTTNEEGEEILVTDPSEILKVAPTQYTELLKNRTHGFDNLSTKWEDIYAPDQRIK